MWSITYYDIIFIASNIVTSSNDDAKINTFRCSSQRAVTVRHSKYRPILGTTTIASLRKGHPITCHRRHREGVDYSSTHSLTSLLELDGCLTPRPGCFTHWRWTPLPTVPETGWPPGPVWAATEKRKSLGPHRRSNPLRVAILKTLSWPLTRDSWHHHEFDLKMMKPGHVNRTGFMAPSSMPPTATDVRRWVHKADQTKIQRG